MTQNVFPFPLALVIVAVATVSTPGNAQSVKAADRTIVSGVRVGAITRTSTQAQLARIYGARNVRAVKVPVGEGETIDGLVLFKGSPSELQIRFKPGTKRVEWVVVNRRGSPWRTRNGVGIGTSAARLATLNGARFKLYGFAWDYAGRSAGWNGGRLSKSLVVDLEPTRKLPDREQGKVAGDGTFWSDHPVIQRMRLTVYRILLEFK
jgi:hypothetical protein